jgi:hypothetical protein
MVTAKWSTKPGARFLYAGNFVTATSTCCAATVYPLTKMGTSPCRDTPRRGAGAAGKPCGRLSYRPGSSAFGSLWRSESRKFCMSRAASTLPA